MKHVKGFIVGGIVEIYRLWNPSGNANCAQIHAGGYLRRIFGSLARKGCVSWPKKLLGGSPSQHHTPPAMGQVPAACFD